VLAIPNYLNTITTNISQSTYPSDFRSPGHTIVFAAWTCFASDAGAMQFSNANEAAVLLKHRETADHLHLLRPHEQPIYGI